MFIPGLPMPVPKGFISTQLTKLRRDVDSLRPLRAPGVLTTHTTAGVARRATGQTWRRKAATAQAEARWA